MYLTCGYCGKEITPGPVINFKGVYYHALQGIYEGRLIHVQRQQSCFELSDFGAKSLVNVFPPVLVPKDH